MCAYKMGVGIPTTMKVRSDYICYVWAEHVLLSNYGRYRLKWVCELEFVGIVEITKGVYQHRGSVVSQSGTQKHLIYNVDI